MRQRHRASGDGSTGAHMLCWRRTASPVAQDGPAIIFVPGGGGTETSWQAFGTTANPNVATRLMRHLVEVGGCRFISIATNWEWGSDDTTERILDGWEHAKEHYGFPSKKIHLVTVSAGALGGLNSMLLEGLAPYVASISMVIPALDLDDIEANPNRVTWGIPAPSDAYGGSIPADRNPIENASAFTGARMAIWYSNNDAICKPEITEAFGEASEAELHNLGDRFPPGFAIPGHDAGNLPLDDVLSFISGRPA